MSGVKDKLKKGEVVYGQMILELFSAGIGPMLAATGMEFVLYDMEHGRCDMGLLESDRRSLTGTSLAAETDAT